MISMGSAVNGHKDKSKMVERREMMHRHREGRGMRRVVMTPRTSCDVMYKWAMWRMFLNEDMSRALSYPHVTRNTAAAHALGKMADKRPTKSGKSSKTKTNATETASSIAAVYTGHRSAIKCGRAMKDMSQRCCRSEEMERILPDNMYLVFGLPRVSLAKDLPKGVQELYASTEKLDTRDTGAYHKKEEHLDTDKCINKLFDFVTDEIKYENITNVAPNGKFNLKSDQRKFRESSLLNSVPNWYTSAPPDIEFYNDASLQTMEPPRDEADRPNTPLPLVSKSRLFFEQLASSKSQVTDPDPTEVKLKSQPREAISSDALLKQQKLLKKTKPEPRSSRDLWRTLAQRKHEILQLRDWDNNQEPRRKHIVKRQESKTSQLLGYIFSKKTEMAQMKRNKSDNIHIDKNVSDKKLTGAGVKTEMNGPENFQDNFQKELEAKLKKFRERAEDSHT